MDFETEMEAWLLGTGCCNMLRTGSTAPSPFQEDVFNGYTVEASWFNRRFMKLAAKARPKIQKGNSSEPTPVFQVRTVSFREVNHHIGCILSGWGSDSKLELSTQAIHPGENHRECKMLIKFWFLFSFAWSSFGSPDGTWSSWWWIVRPTDWQKSNFSTWVSDWLFL